MICDASSLADLPLTDWRSIFQPGNLLSFAGIAATVYYALRAERKATSALQAAESARKDLLVRFAAEEFQEVLQAVLAIVTAAQSDNMAEAERIARTLNGVLATAKSSWPDLLQEIQHEEVELALRENQRVLSILGNEALGAAEKKSQVVSRADLISQLLAQVYGRLRFRS